MTTTDPTKLADELERLAADVVNQNLGVIAGTMGAAAKLLRTPTPPSDVAKLRDAAENLVLCFSSRTARESGIYDEWNALDAALSRK